VAGDRLTIEMAAGAGAMRQIVLVGAPRIEVADPAGRPAGTLYALPPPRDAAEAEPRFVATVNRWLLLSALGAVALALALSLPLSRRILGKPREGAKCRGVILVNPELVADDEVRRPVRDTALCDCRALNCGGQFILEDQRCERQREQPRLAIRVRGLKIGNNRLGIGKHHCALTQHVGESQVATSISAASKN
jgi:hypothetical protein